jgi:hypothetical protein
MQIPSDASPATWFIRQQPGVQLLDVDWTQSPTTTVPDPSHLCVQMLPCP